MTPELKELGDLAATQRYPAMIERAIGYAIKEPRNLNYLDVVAFGYMEAGWRPLALALYSYIKQQNPKFPGVDNNIARVKLDLGYDDETLLHEGRKMLSRAIERTPDDPVLYNNLASYFIHEGDAQKGMEYAQKSMEIGRDDHVEIARAKYNFGIACLMAHKWEEGWWGYDHGTEKRRLLKDYNVPKWDGTEGQTVIVVGEQGLGDELSFASMIPDLQKDCEVIIDCHPRLEGIMRRSFGCTVYPTRKANRAEWPTEEIYDAWIQMASLGAFYRKSDEDFPRKPYLKADPQRCLQWRALLDSLGDKPKIGLAWSGGVRTTFGRRRSLTLDDLKPVLEYDAEFVSLQYRDTDNMPESIHHWPRAVEADDYDETLALINELDLIISVQTTVVHAAGGLGKKVLCLVPNKPQWRYGGTGSELIWYPDVTLYRQEKDWPVQAICAELESMGIIKK